jgi:hypothetical protein
MTISTWRSCIVASAAAAVAVGAFLGGCSSPATSSGSSGKGESCASQFDCASGLNCIDNTCQAGTVAPGAEAGAPTPDGGGKTDSGKPVPDGGTKPETGADTSTAVGSSTLAERCSQTSDCAAGLVCIPSTNNFGGVCDLANYGLTPTGNVCGGECKTATDCYELPVGNPYGVTCDDIIANFLPAGFSTTCNGETTADPPTSNACFYYKTYCQPTAATKVWACTADNKCQYTGACSVSVTDDLDGCPSETRTGVVPTNGDYCDATGTKKCIAGPAAVAPCTSAASCNGQLVADVVGETCNTSTDCVCYKNTGCYIKCASNLDCAAGFSCNTSTQICTVLPSCTTNDDCVQQSGDVRSTCSNGTCGIPCAVDHDCGSRSSGASTLLVDETGGSFNGEVCDPKAKVCVALGCTSDSACSTAGGVNTFCVAPPSITSVATVESAITSN